MNFYTNGTAVAISAAFTDQAGVAIDPIPTVQLITVDPNGRTVTYVYGIDVEIVRDGVGLYHANLLPAVDGIWTYRWVGSANIDAAGEGQFSVQSLVV